MKSKILIPFFRQFLIFFIYLAVSSIFLFNHSGGADIAFLFSFVLCASVHFIATLIKIYVDRQKSNPRKWTYVDILSVAGLLILSILTSNLFFDFMWWLTS